MGIATGRGLGAKPWPGTDAGPEFCPGPGAGTGIARGMTGPDAAGATGTGPAARGPTGTGPAGRGPPGPGAIPGSGGNASARGQSSGSCPASIQLFTSWRRTRLVSFKSPRAAMRRNWSMEIGPTCRSPTRQYHARSIRPTLHQRASPSSPASSHETMHHVQRQRELDLS